MGNQGCVITRREKQVMLLLSDSRILHDYKTISRILGITLFTLKEYTSRMRFKYTTDSIGLAIMGTKIEETMEDVSTGKELRRLTDAVEEAKRYYALEHERSWERDEELDPPIEIRKGKRAS